MDLPLTQEEQEAAAKALIKLARRILLGDAEASALLHAYLLEADVAWERQALALIALLMLPTTTIHGAREFMEMAFIDPLLRVL